jgi:hypothetical protein
MTATARAISIAKLLFAERLQVVCALDQSRAPAAV